MRKNDLLQLWGNHARRCAFPDCKISLFQKRLTGHVTKIGDRCHIIGKSSCGPRGHPSKSDLLKEDIDNIILMCKNHHKIIDDDPITYTEDRLRKMKSDHYDWIEERLSTELIDEFWTMCILSDHDFGSIDENLIKNQLFPDFNFTNSATFISEGKPKSDEQWRKAKATIFIWWEKIQQNISLPTNLSIFAITHIPFLIYTGYLIRDSRSIRLFQYDRFRNTWRWQNEPEQIAQTDFIITPVTSEEEEDTEIVISVSISNKIAIEKIREVLPSTKIIEFAIDNPSRVWLKYKSQLTSFKEIFIELLDQTIQTFPNIKIIHLFCAVPAPFALAIGSLINPAIFPTIQTYKYFRKNTPSYEKAIKFNDI